MGNQVKVGNQEWEPIPVTLQAGDIQIGAIEIKDADNSNRANVITANGYLGLVTVTPGHISDTNSTSSPLSAGATFTGTSTETINHGIAMVSVFSDVASATDGLSIQFSSDNTNWDITDEYTIPANKGKIFSVQTSARYMRVVYTNGGSNQTAFRLQTVMKPYYVKPSSHRVADSITGQDDSELVKAVITGENPAGTFVNFQSTTAGNFKISLEEMETAVTEFLDKFQTNEIEEASATITYIGAENKAGTWYIKKIDTTSGTVFSHATQANNGGTTTYTTAWTNRASLTYGDYSEAF